MAAAGINHFALGVHHIVVFEQVLTDTEVVLLYLTLRAFDRPRHHTGLDHFAFLQSHSVHQSGDPFRTEQPHQVIFQRYEEQRRTGVSLTSGTSAQLTVDPA